MPFFWTSWFRAQENLDKATFVFPTFDLGFNGQNVGVICEVQEAAPFEPAPTGNQHYEFELAVDLPIFMKGIRAEENQCDGYEKITIIKSNLIFPLKTKQHALIYEDFKWDFFLSFPLCWVVIQLSISNAQKIKKERNVGFSFWKDYLLNSLSPWLEIQNTCLKIYTDIYVSASAPLLSLSSHLKLSHGTAQKSPQQKM